MHRWLNSRSFIYWGVAIFSGLLTLYRSSVRDVINNDGILYVNVAKAFLNGGFGSAFDVYHWPFYGILIGLIHKITGLGIENSAYGLNTFLMVLVCVVFVRIYEEISDSEARIWVAAILILALPVLNDYRDLVVRGFGFWAFMLVALYYFIQYSRSPGFQSALKWQLGIAAATLFRVEGIAFLFFSPFFFLFVQGVRSKILAHILRLNSVYIVLLVAAVLMMLISGSLRFSDGMQLPQQLDYSSPMSLFSALNTEAEMMFGRNQFMQSVEEARLILASGLLVLVFIKVAVNIGLPFLMVWGYGVHRKWLKLTRESYIVAYFSGIGLLTLIPVAGNYFFLSSRYTVLTVLLVSMIVFQYVDYLFRKLSRHKLYKWNVVAGVFVLALFLDGIISGGYSKRNIRVAGEWVVAEMAEVTGRMVCNEARLEFYSEGKCEWIMFSVAAPGDVINDLVKEKVTYLLLWIGRKDDELRSAVGDNPALVLRKEFTDTKGGSVRLYSVISGGM